MEPQQPTEGAPMQEQPQQPVPEQTPSPEMQQPMKPAPAPEAPMQQSVPDMSQPAMGQPMQPATQPIQQASTATDPGHGLGLASLITSLLGMGLISLILGLIAKSKSKKAGFKNGLATAGIIISIVSMIAGVLIFTLAVFAGYNAAQKCAKLGAGVHYDNGSSITCN